MTNTKTYLGLALATTLAFAIGCQPEPNRNSTKFGRRALGSPTQRPTGTGGDAVVNQAGDGEMTRVAQLLALPALSSLPEYQLTNVSAQTGVKIWAEAFINGTGEGTGSLDGARSRIHIEVTDANAAKYGAFTLHVGYDQDGFEGAEGGVTANSVALRFDQAGYGSVIVVGQINGGTFSGQVSFVNTMTDNRQETLGNFTMQACSFFVCR